MFSCLLQSQRRKIHPELFTELLPQREETVRRLSTLLRLAVLLNRGRQDEEAPQLVVDDEGTGLQLQVSNEWAETHPLTLADLEQEQSYLKAHGFNLSVEIAPA